MAYLDTLFFSSPLFYFVFLSFVLLLDSVSGCTIMYHQSPLWSNISRQPRSISSIFSCGVGCCRSHNVLIPGSTFSIYNPPTPYGVQSEQMPTQHLRILMGRSSLLTTGQEKEASNVRPVDQHTYSIYLLSVLALRMLYNRARVRIHGIR